MKKNKVIGVLLLVLVVFTIVGMVLANDVFWLIYNYIVLMVCALSGIALLKQK